MKKIVAIILALALVFTMSAVAFAASMGTATDTTKYTATAAGDVDAEVLVKITFNDDTIPEDKQPQDPGDVDPEYATYSVTIDASDVVFTYSITDISSYDPATHAYTAGGWDKTNGNIKVANDSNTSIKVSADFSEEGPTKNNVTASLATNEINLGSAAAAEETVNGTIGVSITGTPNVTNDYTLATVILTIEGVEA